MKVEFVPQEPLEALPILVENHQKHGEDAKILLALAICRFRAGEIVKAEQLLRSVLQQKPGQPRARIFLTRLLIESQKFAAAKKILWGKADLSPSIAGSEEIKLDDRFWNLSSRLAEENSDMDEALQYVDRALEIKSHKKNICLVKLNYSGGCREKQRLPQLRNC